MAKLDDEALKAYIWITPSINNTQQQCLVVLAKNLEDARECLKASFNFQVLDLTSKSRSKILRSSPQVVERLDKPSVWRIKVKQPKRATTRMNK